MTNLFRDFLWLGDRSNRWILHILNFCGTVAAILIGWSTSTAYQLWLYGLACFFDGGPFFLLNSLKYGMAFGASFLFLELSKDPRIVTVGYLVTLLFWTIYSCYRNYIIATTAATDAQGGFAWFWYSAHETGIACGWLCLIWVFGLLCPRRQVVPITHDKEP